MNRSLEVIPSILTNDPIELTELLTRCEGVVERVSIDIVDGRFVNNKTVDPGLLAETETDLLLDFQLMVEEPIHWIERCVRGQADRIIGHIEKMNNQIDFIAKVQEVGRGVGLALNLETGIVQIDPEVFSDLDVILLMSTEVGFGGKPFDQRVLPKIGDLDKLRTEKNLHFKIQTDGGINESSIYNVFRQGADEVSVGRRLFEGNLAENIRKFESLAQ